MTTPDPLRIARADWLQALQRIGITDLDDLLEVRVDDCAKGGTLTTVRVRRDAAGGIFGSHRPATITTEVHIEPVSRQRQEKP